VTFDQRSPVRGEQWVLHSGESVFLIDVIARSTHDLLPGHRVRSMAPVNRIVPIDANPDQPARDGAKPRWEYQIWLAVRTDDRIVLLNPEAGLREEYALPPIWGNREISLYLSSDGLALLISYVENSIRDVRPGFRQYENDVAWISSTGELRRQTRVAIEHRVNAGQVEEQSSLLLATLSVAGPLQSALVAGGIIPWFDSTAHGTRFADRAAVSLEGTWIGLLFVTIAAAGLAWLTDRRQRKFREPRSYMWMAFVFFLGIPGYVAYFCHRRWPVLHPAPPPSKTGTEIMG
jgi:hypothetical protein